MCVRSASVILLYLLVRGGLNTSVHPESPGLPPTMSSEQLRSVGELVRSKQPQSQTLPKKDSGWKCAVRKPVKKTDAIRCAKQFLKLRDLREFSIKSEEAVITHETYNTYRRLQAETKRPAWVISFTTPDAVGSSRTVYVDKQTGEILGGFSSK